MADAQLKTRSGLTHEDYFALEETEDQRYEYLAGEVFAMAGGTESHALIGTNTVIALGSAFRDKPCRVYGPDMRIYMPAHDKFCYPDVMVLCEAGRRHERYVEEPALIVEVLSETTEAYDRGLKFEQYRSIEALRYYLLLSQERPHAELYHREAPDLWSFREATGESAGLVLAEWDIVLPLSELYRNVDF